MRTKERGRNFIIYILLVFLIAAGNKAKLDAVRQVSVSLCSYESETLISYSSVLNMDCLAGQVQKQQNEAMDLEVLQQDRTEVFYQNELFFLLAALAVLSVLFQSKREILIRQGSRHIVWKHYMVDFMQDMDGRKRAAYADTSCGC